MGISVEELNKTLREVNMSTMISLEDYLSKIMKSGLIFLMMMKNESLKKE